MGKIKYQGGITKLIASRLGNKNRIKFFEYIFRNDSLKNLIQGMDKMGAVDIEIVSFSSSNDFCEQVLSILSFIRYVGVPSSWTIYSDGSHKASEIALLEKSIPWVKLFIYDLTDSNLLNKVKAKLKPWFNELLDYAVHKPLGKKLFYFLNHVIDKRTLFIDSDILFYEKATIIKTQLNLLSSGYFLPEISWGNLDSRYMDKNQQHLYAINSGFFIVNKELENVSHGLGYLKEYNFEYQYFSEQTVFHALFVDNGFIPLDPRLFVLDVSDQFDFSYLGKKTEMAVRHYTSPIRHKMWQKDWKWQLSIP